MKKNKKILWTIGAVLLFIVLRYLSSTMLLDSFRLGDSFDDNSSQFYVGVIVNVLSYIVPIALIALIWTRKESVNG